MKKEEIYVVIDSEPKRLRAIQILTDAGENILDTSSIFYKFSGKMILRFNGKNWWITWNFFSETEITLDHLEELLNPKQEAPIKLDALKLIAESYGFELVEKKREPKVGDFGKFWDDEEECLNVGFLQNIDDGITSYPFQRYDGTWYINFAHLTDEEKQQIQENW